MKKRIVYIKDNLFIKDYFQNVNDSYILHEYENTGASELTVYLDNKDNLCIEDFDHSKKCYFFIEEKKYGMKKSVDHIVFQNCSGNCTLHLIEMKSAVGYRTWDEVKQKVRSSYLNSLAIATVLGIKVDKVIAHTTYHDLKFSSFHDNNSNPRTYAKPLGEKAYDAKTDEWDKGILRIELGEDIIIDHTSVQMEKTDSGLTGTLFLNNTEN